MEMEGWRGSSGYCTKKSSAEKSKSLWKQWLRAKEANAKVSSNWIFFFFFCASAVFQTCKPFAPTSLEATLPNVPAEGTGPIESGGDRLENGSFTVPKKALPRATKTKAFISVPANLPSDPKRLKMASVSWARMLPDKTIPH